MERFRHRFRGGDGDMDIGAVLQNTLGVGAALLLFSLILVTCVDVVGRYFFSAPLSGAFEITEILLAALVFTALPLTTERKEHIEVDLLNVVLSNTIKRYFSAFAGLFSAALLTTLAWRLASHALTTAEHGATTNALGIPLAPFGYLAAFSCLVSAFIAFLRGIYPANETDDKKRDEHG
ncbi:TRAP transporter small permease [Lentilitoribacter sp. Alg239-R112]|jgi:TRAP-type C4-dicarboxylate transport system permease small subunit|uniref:TRAP transporter small permease n=1 Tax=Lentilitoribacter sp. Alg239-R112 TaxID=2305987 RepID=UPI0018D5F57B|nr:TRAP transporter small permease [Lentilitoribacter sp. Alg239-R112]